MPAHLPEVDWRRQTGDVWRGDVRGDRVQALAAAAAAWWRRSHRGRCALSFCAWAGEAPRGGAGRAHRFANLPNAAPDLADDIVTPTAVLADPQDVMHDRQHTTLYTV